MCCLSPNSLFNFFCVLICVLFCLLLLLLLPPLFPSGRVFCENCLCPRHFDEVIERVNKHHTNSWVIAKYKALLKVMHSAGAVALRVGGVSTTFQVHSPELVDSEGNLVAGELGYRIGNTYTSLTGFFDSSSKLPTGQLKHTSAGKIQLVALGKLLRRCGFTMWNLGHPPNLVTGVMRYKSEIGGEVLPRKQFLELWRQARDVNTAQPLVTPPEGLSARELIDHVF
eukprot:c12046_g1_i5.p1 GENE.c12046_g1_i5~~c12046_g1_i5.p1  ORF type:complete len:226 (+),score=36.49 c12046_g1_i5:710-1387(+)